MPLVSLLPNLQLAKCFLKLLADYGTMTTISEILRFLGVLWKLVSGERRGASGKNWSMGLTS